MKRTNTRLLRTVNGRPHATEDDHEDPVLPTPPASNSTRNDEPEVLKTWQEDDEDVFRDPESGGEEAPVNAQKTADTKSSGFQLPARTDGANDAKPQKDTKFQLPSSAPQFPQKRKTESLSGSDDDLLFGSQPTPAKKSKQDGANLGNIHSVASGRSAKQTVYGKKGRIMTNKSKKITRPKNLAEQPEPQRPKFKQADIPKFAQPKVAFQSARGSDEADAGAEHSPSPPYSSSLSSAESLEEVDMAAFDQSKPDPLLVDCAICGTEVSKLLRQEFVDKFCAGKAMNYKWQGYFCRYHKVDSARIEAEQKGFPNVDWITLDRRLEQHHEHLLDVLEGRKPSIYRTKLERRVASGKAKSGSALMRNKDKSKHDDFSLGYYGPRGEKLMTEHITRHFGDQLRKLSVKDPLLKAYGLAGGVSGFVQAVLVPELAVTQVKLDMSVDGKRAAEIMGESAEIGELLNGEEREKVGGLEEESE